MSDFTDKAKKVVDDVAGAGTSDKIAGKTRDAVGQVKEKVGDATDNHDLKSEGLEDQVKGTAQETVGDAKGVIGHIVDDVKHVTENAIDAVKHKLHKEEATKP